MISDPFLLARMQFAANISFHILFPSISIALAWFLLFFKLRFNKTQDQKWLDAYKLWVKIFALCFALGVVSGITMSFQFGTNWPGFMERVGNIAGPLLGYEVLSAFFLEATFLAVMLYGYNKVPDKVHTLAILLVAGGTTLSAFWILVLNSWMQTPAGFEMIEGHAHATDWLAILFNPSMPWRMLHMLLASGITTSFLIAGLSAYQYLKDKTHQSALAAIKASLYTAAVLVPIQIWVGDLHGLNSFEHQPAKVAAMEAVWDTQRGADLLLFAIPDEVNQTNRMEIAIPKGASLILTHSLDGEIKGLKDFDGVHPPVKAVFYGFRIMVGIGLLMLLVAWMASYRLYRQNRIGKWMLRTLVLMTFSGWVATLAGWYVTEIGRQPWLVEGVLKTADCVAHNVTGPMIAGTLTLYMSVYVVLLISFISVLFYMARKALNPRSVK